MTRANLRRTRITPRAIAIAIITDETRSATRTTEKATRVFTKQTTRWENPSDVNLDAGTTRTKAETHPPATTAEEFALLLLIVRLLVASVWNTGADWPLDDEESDGPPIDAVLDAVVGFAVWVAITV